jgi:opacity protein-like surface antigen
VSINSAAGTATAGIRNRFVAGAVIGEDLYQHIGGEIRYVYQDGDPFISMGGVRGNIQGQSHSFSYDVLFHLRDPDYKFRPYIAAGIGAKYYRVTGPAPVPQPLPQVASLATENDWKIQYDFGFGVKYRLSHHVYLRADFRDYITPFPKDIFVAVPGATDRGIFNQFTPTVGITYAFDTRHP